MPPKKKHQSTMDKFYGYSTISKTSNVEEISYIPDLNDEPNEDMEEEPVDDLEILGHDTEGQEGRSSSQRRKVSSKCEFQEEWKIKHHWVYSINVEDGKTRMKCRLCEKYKAQGPWGVGNGCNTIQYDVVITHSKSSNHQTSVQKKLFEIERLAKPIPEHIVTINESNKERVITTMKLAYFIA